jgi:hypothetical protein
MTTILNRKITFEPGKVKTVVLPKGVTIDNLEIDFGLMGNVVVVTAVGANRTYEFGNVTLTGKKNYSPHK